MTRSPGQPPLAVVIRSLGGGMPLGRPSGRPFPARLFRYLRHQRSRPLRFGVQVILLLTGETELTGMTATASLFAANLIKEWPPTRRWTTSASGPAAGRVPLAPLARRLPVL